MKKNCNGCKALCSDGRAGFMRCDLGYKNEASKRIMGIIVEYRPLEECPKPKRNEDYIYLRQLHNS